MKFFSHRSSRINNYSWDLVLVPLPNKRISAKIANSSLKKKKLTVTKTKGKKE
tara:strand:+ start:254 stop:412 length:159 start_codon:yes stop_codon:yes gene_type:complete